MATQLKTEPPRETNGTDLWEARQLPRSVNAGFAIGGLVVAAVLWQVMGMGLAGAIIMGWLAAVVGLAVTSQVVEGSRKRRDRTATALIYSAFGVAVLPLAGLLYTVISKGAPAIDAKFLTY